MAAGARPVAGGTDLVVGARQGKAPLPEAIVAIDRIDGAARDRRRRRRAAARRARRPTRRSWRTPVVRERFTRSPTRPRSSGSHATRAQGTIGGNVMNASPAMDTGGAAAVLRRDGDAAVGHGRADGRARRAVDRPGRRPPRPDELLVAVDLPAPAAGTGSCYVRLEYRRQMEIAVVGATAVVTVDGGAVTDARIAITALAPTIRRVAEAEAALAGTDGGGDAVDAAAARRGRRGRRRSATCAASAEYRRAMAEVIARRAIAPRSPAPAASRPDPREPRRCTAPEERAMKVAATLTVNGTDYPVELDPHVSLLRAVREELGLTGSKEGCDDSECGACMMLLDGKPVNACSYLALQAEGKEVTTVEGLAGDEEVGAAAAGVPAAVRRAVRLLHAGHADLGDGAAPHEPRSRPTRRSGSDCRGTSADARATTAS